MKMANCGLTAAFALPEYASETPIIPGLWTAMPLRGLRELERQIGQLSAEEQLWLIERLARRLRRRNPDEQIALETELAEMAADADIQREMRAIEEEFRSTEGDGLGHT